VMLRELLGTVLQERDVQHAGKDILLVLVGHGTVALFD
jgi:hypothetical protein